LADNSFTGFVHWLIIPLLVCPLADNSFTGFVDWLIIIPLLVLFLVW